MANDSLNEQLAKLKDIDYSKNNLMYYKLKDISTLVNEDDAITDISYNLDLSRKKNLDKFIDKNFISYLHFPK